jgi:putative hemolysin
VGHRHIHSPEEIDLLIAESREGGLLEPDEHRRLRRALQLAVRPARHLMVPRNQISAIDVDTPWTR